MSLCLDHVSILVKSVDESIKKLVVLEAPIGKKEIFKDVGTEEIYIGNMELNGLLLLQAPIDIGPYLNAAHKRGFGLHHIAIATINFEALNRTLSDLGWYVHPRSLSNYKKGNTVFYIKPGIHTILEIIPRKELLQGSSYIEEVLVQVKCGYEKCINEIGLSELKASCTEMPHLVINHQTYEIGSII